MVVGLLCQCLALVLIYFFARTSVVAYIILYGFFFLTMYFYFCFNANYTIDTGEYHLHKTGKDNRSVANGMMNIPFKIGLLVGGSVPMFVLEEDRLSAEHGTDAPEFINKFMMMFALFPAAFCLLAAIIMQFFYKITDADAARYARENQERAAAAMAASGKTA